MRRVLFSLLIVLLVGCGASPQRQPAAVASDAVAATRDTARVRTGAQVLVREGLERLRGKRVGLVVNHTARVDTTHLIDVLHRAEGVTVAALFGPEHGLRGTADAGEKVADGRDERTGAPVYSLYGDTRKPTAAMLAGLDVLVFDIQDVGVRFYTYVSTMGLAMQAAAEADLPFVVLDRPNPLGGDYVSGFVLEPAFRSFVGQYPIPVAHGLTVGELARMIQGEQMLPGLDDLMLEVVPMEGWRRAERWPATGLPWPVPSPNLPDVTSTLVYPGACFFEATSASEGRGTRHPFALLGAPWADGAALADTLNARALPGVQFEAAAFTPASLPGMATRPKLEGEAVQGIRYVLTDAGAFRPVEAGLHVLHAFYAHAQQRGSAFLTRPEWLDTLAGTEQLGAMLRADRRPEAIIAAYQDEAKAFRVRRTPYLLYE